MTIRFVPQGKNYHPENIKQIIENINEPVVKDAVKSEKKEVRVIGDIHYTQWTSDNPENHYWFRFSVHDENGDAITGYSGIHVFVCFRVWDFHNGKFKPGKCIRPNPYKGGDVADISNLYGGWEMKKITYGFQQSVQQNAEQIKRTIPKRQRKRISIIDPKTGKKIEF